MILTAAVLRQAGVASEVGGILLVASALQHWGHWSGMAALAGGTAIGFIVFALSVAAAFAISLRWPDKASTAARQSQRHGMTQPLPLGPSKAVTCLLRECYAVFRLFNWLQPFRYTTPFAPPAGPARAATLLLVHGYGCNHAVWLDMQPALAAAGYRCDAIDMLPVFGDIDHFGALLLARMHAIETATGVPPLLLCHSMGGLAARAALRLARQAGEAMPCAGLVTIGTPHHGCTLARLGSGINATQMQPDNHWLRTLEASESAHDRAAIVSLFSWHDSIAGPPGGAWLEGARNIAFSGIGHVTLVRDHAVTQTAIGALDAFDVFGPSQRRPSAP
jgi:pimeloyl-ACP methyl ester carboxylesterase